MVAINNFPRISIVTPSFNQAQFLEAAIQSILDQKYPNLEYIIIDGGSTDGSVEIIKKYEKYLHFWCSEPDAGQYDAINKGFAQSTGEIMAWLNSDDMYCPWALKTVASIFSALPQVDWLTTLNQLTWDWHDFCQDVKMIPGYSREAFLDGCYLFQGKKAMGVIQQESTFWRRRLWEKEAGCIYTKFKLAGDFNLWCRFYKHAELYSLVSPLGGFRKQRYQKSCQTEQYRAEVEESHRMMRRLFKWHPNTYRNIIRNLKLHRIPKINNFVVKVCGYHGKKIVRKNLNSPDGFWSVEEYNFFY